MYMYINLRCEVDNSSAIISFTIIGIKELENIATQQANQLEKLRSKVNNFLYYYCNTIYSNY